MTSDMTQAQHTAQLGFLKAYLDEKGWSSQLVEQGDQRSVSVLVAAAPPDRHGRERSIAVAYVPLDSDDLEHISLLQLYSPLPFSLDPRQTSEVDALFAVVNAALPMGHFGHRDGGELFLKYVYTPPQFEMVDADQFFEVFMLFFGMQETFGEVIEGVATGRKSLVDALSKLPVDPLPVSVGVSAEAASIIDTVRAYLDATGIPYTAVRQSGLAMEIEGNHETYTCFVMARERDRQFIFYTASPIEIPPDRVDAVIEFITRANYGLYLGNFEIDLDDNDLRFKTSIGIEDDVLTPALISQVIYPNVATMDKYFPGLRAVVDGGMAVLAALEQVEG